MSSPILSFAGVTKSFSGGQRAVNDVSFDVPAGQFCVVLGPSGAGKSTLLRMVNGLVAPTQGGIEFQGQALEQRNLRAIQPRIAMVHQQFNLVPRLSVLKNVLAGTLPRVSMLRSLFGLFPRTTQRRACELLAEVGLKEEYLYRQARRLSGGEQQRVAIARAFVLEPELVLADEPVASLDPQTSRVILELLRDASNDHGATVVCSLHQVDLALEFANRIVGMQRGQIVFDGKPSELNRETIDSIYISSNDPQSDDKDTGGLSDVLKEDSDG